MKKLKNVCIWFFMLNKRLFKKMSFLLILCLIPLLVVGMTFLAKDESGILKIVLCSEQENDSMANEIIETLMNDEGIIAFSVSENVQDAYEKVTTGQADAAWIFKSELARRIDDYASSKIAKKPFVTVVERESDISLQLSHEKLYGAVFPRLSYSIYKNFVVSEIISFQEIGEEILKNNYDPFGENTSLIISEKLNGAEEEKQQDYLTVPLRGLLSVVVVLCGLAAVMYYQKDKQNGVYNWLCPRKHIIPEFGTCFAAIFDTAVAVLIALLLSGIFTSVFREMLALLLFAFAATGFCMLIGAITRRAVFTGQLIPFVILVCIVLSPIFFNFRSMAAFQRLLPTYHYLYAVTSPVYLLNLVCYSLITITMCYILNRIFERD